ncbi:MAG: zinc-ribbon domain-containing protein [Oscillospiraceae bacterium]|jgi:uncharacterized membrane protein|nr:zinc-ribbon domain-containing protein [Oscillospiraceae bacterium]
MAFCGHCGTQAADGVKFCPSCGKEIAAAPAQQTQPQQQYQQATYSNDASQNKVMAILSYIIFFIPLLTGDHKKSPFVKFHANQGTVLAIVAIAYSIVSAILRAIVKVPVKIYGISTGVSYTPLWFSTILWLISLPIAAACIYGIYNAATGKTKELPVIGKFTIIK